MHSNEHEHTSSWLALPSQKEFVTMSLSSSACAMLNQLKGNLQRLKCNLNEVLKPLWLHVDVSYALHFYSFYFVFFSQYNNNSFHLFFVRVITTCVFILIQIFVSIILEGFIRSSLAGYCSRIGQVHLQ